MRRARDVFDPSTVLDMLDDAGIIGESSNEERQSCLSMLEDAGVVSSTREQSEITPALCPEG